MANTLIRGNTQIRDNTIDRGKLDNVGLTNGQGFLDGSDWDITNGSNNATITGIKDPVNAQDVASKAYVDSVAAGLDPKESVRVATSTGLSVTASGSGVGKTLTATSNGAISIDGISLISGDRVLVKDQANAVDNGIYTVTTVGDAGTAYVLTRAVDFDGSPANEVFGGAFTFVELGTTNANTGWVVSADGSVTVDTNDIDWVQFSGAGTYTAGDGLDLTGSQFSVDVTDLIDTNAGLGEDGSNNIQVKLGSNEGLEFNGSGEIVVDVTDIIDTAAGLTESGGDIQVNITANTGLDFNGGTGALEVDVTDLIDTSKGLTETSNVVEVKLESDGAIVFDGINGGLELNVDGTSLAITTNTLGINADGVNETHIDWGSGSNEVDATSVPIDTGGTWSGTATNVQDALEELEASIPTVTRYYAEEVTVTNNQAAVGALSNLPVEASTEAVYLNGVRQQPGAGNDYTINTTSGVITFTFNLHTNDKVIVDYAA